MQVAVRCGALLMTVGVAAAGLALAAAPPAQAATADVTLRSEPTWQTDGKVTDVLTVGRTTYLAGSFTALRPPGTGTAPRRRTHLAAVDSTTGALLPWAPVVDRPVATLAVSPDGSTLYAGGAFTKVDGLFRGHAAAFDRSTGALTGWAANTLGDVHAVAVSADRVYLGGDFTRVDGVPRARLAAVDRAGTVVPGWDPSADRTVRALALSPDRRVLWVGGDFSRLRGDTTQKRLARLDAATGRPQPLRSRPAYPLWSVIATADRVWVGGDGAGGHVGTFRADGSRGWTRQTDGSVQGMALRDGVLYVGGHFGAVCVGDTPGGASGGGFVCGTVDARRARLLALDAATGAVDAWSPGANTPLGVFALDSTGGRLRVGGTFTVLGGRAQQGYGSFAPAR